MLVPIEKDHELICPGCGCVLKNIEEPAYEEEKSPVPPSLNIYLLGTAVDKNVKHRFQRSREQLYEERVLRQLLDITKEYALPDRFAYAAFHDLKRKRSGFRSEKEPIKQLISILSKDDNYIYFPKMRAIKAKFTSVYPH